MCAAADFIVCASEKQRDLWLGGLALRGLITLDRYRADPSLRSLIDVVPFGLPAEPPRPAAAPVLKGAWPGIGPDDRVLLWGGGIWNWLDATTCIDAVARLDDLDPPVHLVFQGLERPGLEPVDAISGTPRALAHAETLGLLGKRVHVNHDWVPYAERGAWLLEADLGVSAHHDHLEARFSFRTRVLDYLWAGLPYVGTAGDALADLVERRGLGRTVPPEDPDAFAAACRALLTDRAEWEAAAERIAELRPTLTWAEAVKPLARFCARPAAPRAAPGAHRRPDRRAVPADDPRDARSPRTHRVGAQGRAAGVPSGARQAGSALESARHERRDRTEPSAAGPCPRRSSASTVSSSPACSCSSRRRSSSSRRC